jgi:hypothetical protein
MRSSPFSFRTAHPEECKFIGIVEDNAARWSMPLYAMTMTTTCNKAKNMEALFGALKEVAVAAFCGNSGAVALEVFVFFELRVPEPTFVASAAGPLIESFAVA